MICYGNSSRMEVDSVRSKGIDASFFKSLPL